MINRHYLSLLTNDFYKCPIFNHDELIQHGDRLEFEEINCFSKKIIEGSGIGAWCFNCKTEELYFNEAYLKTLSFSNTEQEYFTYQKLRELIHVDDLIRSEHIFKKHLNGETEQFEYFLRIKNKFNQFVGVLIRGKALIFDSNHNPLWVFGTQIDITD